MSRRVLRGAVVFDGSRDEPFAADIAIEGDRFVEVGQGLAGDEVVDLAGRSVVPGLFDCHVHVLGVEPKILDKLNEPFSFQFYNGARNLVRLLECGITTVRDCAGADLGVKRALEDGLIQGPRLQISITALSQTGGHMDGWAPSSHWVDPYYVPHPGRPDSICDSVDGVRKVVRQSLRAGADFIKVLATHWPNDRSRFTDEELMAIGEEAAAAGVPVVMHALGSGGAKSALQAGARSVEHIAELDDEAIQMFLDKGAWLVPTVAMVRPFLETQDYDDGVNDFEMIGHQTEDTWDGRLFAETAFEALGRAYAAGVKIAMGTDYGNTSGDNLEELSAMVHAGLSPAAAMKAATSSAAALLGVDADLGTIEAGKLADLVVLEGTNPLDDFDTMKSRIRGVYMNGRLVHAVS